MAFWLAVIMGLAVCFIMTCLDIWLKRLSFSKFRRNVKYGLVAFAICAFIGLPYM